MRSSIVALTALALVSAGANAHASKAASSTVGELRAAKEHAELQAGQTKGGPQHLLLMKSQRISNFIDRLERGESVDPKEIDRLLEESGPTAR
jgi:hypothetical protein